MRTLQQFMPNLFADYSDSITNITTMANKLSGVSVVSSTFQNALSVSKLVSNQTDMSKFSTNMFDHILTISDLGEFNEVPSRSLEYTNIYHEVSYGEGEFTDTECAVNHLIEAVESKIGYFNYADIDNNTIFNTIGTYQGVPIQAAVVHVPNDIESEILPCDKWIYFCFGVQEVYNGQLLAKPFLGFRLIKPYPATSPTRYHVTMEVFQPEDDRDPWHYVAPARVDGHTEYNYFDTHIEDILNELMNSYLSFECIQNIIKRAQTDGNITRDQIDSIIAKYEHTDVTDYISSLIAGTKSFSSISIITLVGKILQNMGSDYNSGDTFNIYEEPNFITNIINAIVSILITTVAIILSVIWHTVGIIVSMLASLMQVVMDMITRNIAQTQSCVVRDSLAPVINNPLITVSYSKTEMEIWLSHKASNITIDELDSVLKEFGCAMVGPNYYGSCPYYYWVLPPNWDDDTSKYIMQLMVTASKPIKTGHMSLSLDILSQTGSAGYEKGILDFTWYNDGGDPITGRIYSAYEDANYEYMSATDNEIRNCIWLNTIKALSDFCCFNDTYLNSKYGNSNDNNPSTPIWINKYLDAYGNFSATLCNIDRIIATLDDCDQDNLISSWNSMRRLSYITHLLTMHVGHGSLPSWPDLNKLYKYIHDNMSFNNVYAQRQTVYSNALLTYFNMGDGHEIAQPALEWPNLSRTALITALIITGLTAAAIAGVAIGTKIGLKKMAFNRLATSQMKFDKASNDFKTMNDKIKADKEHMGGYTSDQIKKIEGDYYRANRKLTRAWSFAGKMGLSMYNGFSTGSSSVKPTGQGSDVLSNITTNALSDVNGSNSYTTSEQAYNDNLSQAIFGSITGQIYS